LASYRRLRSTRLLVTGLLVASLVTITVDARSGDSGPLAAMGRIGLAIVTPLQKGLSAVAHPITSFFGNLFRAGALAEENAALRAQLGGFAESLAGIPELDARIARLNALLDLKQELGFTEGIGAEVIGAAPGNFYWTIEVNRGSADGVVEDMTAITGGPSGGGLVGRVSLVGPSSSYVQLIVDPDESAEVAARLVDSRERGILSGGGESDLTFVPIYSTKPIEVGDDLVTFLYRLPSGEGAISPGGIPIGEVSSVGGTPADPQIRVRPFVDFSTIEEVFLVPPADVIPLPEAQAP